MSYPASSKCVAKTCRNVSPHYSSFVDSSDLLPPPPLLDQTVEIIRWLRRQTSESLVIKLQDGLELHIPWMLDPLACRRVYDAPAPRLTVEALLALHDLLNRQPLLHAAPPLRLVYHHQKEHLMHNSLPPLPPSQAACPAPLTPCGSSCPSTGASSVTCSSPNCSSTSATVP